MSEFDEFADAMLGQLAIEINEEKDIMHLAEKANEDLKSRIKFNDIQEITDEVLPSLKAEVEKFLGMQVPQTKVEYPELKELKKIKGYKVFSDAESNEFVNKLFVGVANEDKKEIARLMREDTAKYLVYSTYAIQYISKISTTYGDYLNGTIFLNRFILSRYPLIILHKQGEPYDVRFDMINSGYRGAIKMTVLEEMVHSVQTNLQEINARAAMQVNKINEELARKILSLDNSTVNILTEYLQLQAVPDEFPFAKKANLFFFLNPDHFLIEQIGPDVMTFTHVEIDPKISESIPELLDIYKKWLIPIQQHHSVFTIMEGMAAFALENILKEDKDFQNYLTTYIGTDFTSYQVRKDMGKEFTKLIYERLGKKAFRQMIEEPPNTREIKEPQLYLKRIKQ